MEGFYAFSVNNCPFLLRPGSFMLMLRLHSHVIDAFEPELVCHMVQHNIASIFTITTCSLAFLLGDHYRGSA